MIDFSALKEAISIEQAADLLGLKMNQVGNQLRSCCPACETTGGRELVITPSRAAFYCFSARKGGDLISLAAHILNVPVKDAAQYLADQIGESSTRQGTNTSTVKSQEPRQKFDPVEFQKKLQYTDEVKALGLTEEDATNARVGFYRGHLYLPRVYPSGTVAGWWKLVEGKLIAPPQWLPDASNVIALKRAG